MNPTHNPIVRVIELSWAALIIGAILGITLVIYLTVNYLPEMITFLVGYVLAWRRYTSTKTTTIKTRIAWRPKHVQ